MGKSLPHHSQDKLLVGSPACFQQGAALIMYFKVYLPFNPTVFMLKTAVDLARRIVYIHKIYLILVFPLPHYFLQNRPIKGCS